jgi:N,N'-diacetyllegionaminate synthase
LDHPLAWSLTIDERGVLSAAAGFDPRRRQTQSAAYRPVGCYLCTAEFVRTRGAFAVPGETVGVEVPRSRAIDIDDRHDLEAARALLGANRERSVTIRTHAGPRTIGEGRPCFVIAEAGVNHNGDPDLARRLVDAAADAGADAVKFQTFRAGELVTGSARMAAYQRTNLGVEAGSPSSQASMLRALELAEPALASLKAHAESRGLVFLSSPFDLGSAGLLAGLGVGALKLGSGELTNHPFLESLAGMGLPLLLSTGMATLSECEDAARVLRAHGDPPALWFHCVSAYPAPASASNLRAMDSLRDALGVPVGMSDHSMGDAVTLAAVARGAVAIEKHLTLSRAMEGPDHAASLEPDQFAEMVRKIRLVESALGDGVKRPAACEADTARAARRSLVAASDLPAGHELRARDLVAKRPGDGIPPGDLRSIVGRVLARPIGADEMLTGAHLRPALDAVGRSVA